MAGRRKARDGVPDASKEVRRPSIGWNALPHVLYVLKRVRDPDVPLPTGARLLALFLADVVNTKGSGFVLQTTLAEELKTTVRTVQRHLQLLDGVLFKRSYPGETKGMKHRCARYTVIRNSLEPAEFNRLFDPRGREKARRSGRALCDLGDRSGGSLKGIVTGDTAVASGRDTGVASGVTPLSPQVGEKSRASTDRDEEEPR